MNQRENFNIHLAIVGLAILVALGAYTAFAEQDSVEVSQDNAKLIGHNKPAPTLSALPLGFSSTSQASKFQVGNAAGGVQLTSVPTDTRRLGVLCVTQAINFGAKTAEVVVLGSL